MPGSIVPNVPNRSIAVFGSADPRPGEPEYEEARRLGELLARRGFTVLTGGYGGVMEAACRGARETGGRSIGVTCAIFGDRAPNPYLTETVETEDLYDRSRALIEPAQGYVVLRGMTGTLSELSLLWALDRAGCLNQRPVVLLGVHWTAFLDHLVARNMLEPNQIRLTRIVATPADAVDHLRARLDPE